MSSSAVYPVNLQIGNYHSNLQENEVKFSNYDDFYLPDQTYGWSKLSGEYLAWKIAKDYKKEVYVFRPFSGFGEDQGLDYPVPSLVDKVIRYVKGELPGVTIWGKGTQVRDFVYIDDVVDIILKTRNAYMNYFSKNETIDSEFPFVINIGTGKGTNFIELLKLLEEIVGHEIFYKTLPFAPEGVAYRVADVTKQAEFNLLPPSLTLLAGLEVVVKHYADLHGVELKGGRSE